MQVSSDYGSPTTRLNITTVGEQSDPEIAWLSDSKFVAVWADRSGNDGSEGGIFAQIYTSALDPVGVEFIVNSGTDFWQSKPHVESTSSGDFLVTWHEGNGYLSAQLFQNDGARIGDQFNVRSGFNHISDIAGDTNNGFWVASNVAQDAIYIKKLSPDGTELKSDIKIDSDAFQADPSITVLNDGRVLVAWSEIGQNDTSEIYAQILTPEGALSGQSFRLNETLGEDQQAPVVAALSDGGFAASWESISQDGDGNGIIVRQFNSEISGSNEIIVNDTKAGDQTAPTIIANDKGGFLVGWTDNIHANGGAVYVQEFDGYTQKIGSNALVSDDGVKSLNNSKDIELEMLSDNSFIAAWEAWDGTRDIFARIFSIKGNVTHGSDLDDELIGGDSNDTLYGGAGNDNLNGGNGGDRLYGGEGTNTLDGGAGNDTIILESNGTFGSDLFAYNVSSSLQTGTEESINLDGKIRFGDVMDGGTDVDTVELTDGSDAFFLHDSFSGFHTSLNLTADNNGKSGTARIANIENITSGIGDDIVDLTSPNYSLAGQNITVDGGSGDDTLWGSDANETLKGGEGNDELFGGAGTNVLTGGAGADEFQFTGSSTNDTIKDFSLTDGDTLKFFNTGGAQFNRGSVGLNGDVLSISDGAEVLTITLEGAGLQLDDLGSDVLIIG